MPKFQKRPIEVEAMQYLPPETSLLAIADFIGHPVFTQTSDFAGRLYLLIPSNGGMLTIYGGSYILKDEEGYISDCGPKMFEKQYVASCVNCQDTVESHREWCKLAYEE